MTRVLLTAIFIAISSMPLHAAAAGIDLADFTRDDQFGTIKISPDGEYLAMTAGKGGNTLLLFYSLKERKQVSGVRAGTTTVIADFEWISPSRLVYHLGEVQPGHRFATRTGEIGAIDRDGKRHQMVYGYRAEGQKTGTRLMTQDASFATPTIVSHLRSDDRHILLTEQQWRLRGNTWREDRDMPPVITRLDVHSGRKSKAGVAPLAAARVLVDGNDEVRFAIGYKAEGRLASSWKPEPGAAWQAFDLPGFSGWSVVPHAFSDGGRSVYFEGVRDGQSLLGLYRLDVRSGEVEQVYVHPSVDIDRPIFDDRKETLVGVRVYTDRPEYHWLLPDHPRARLHRALEKAFQGQGVEVTSITDDGSRAIVFVWSDVNPGEYYLLDTKTMNADFVQAAREWIDPRLMRPKEPVQLTARDGVRLHGYLSRPAGDGPHALVVLPHGGPHLRDVWGFDWEVQLLASRGYAVLQVNFRGSSGYGADFESAGYREWGGKIQDDITDATRWALENGIAQPGRVCIVGGSFGGYSALMSAVREPGLYRCAIGMAGVYDLDLLRGSSDIVRSRRGRSYLEDTLGSDVQALRAASPVHHADRIASPVLLIHGTEDWRADFQHAKRMKSALENAKKPYEWMSLRGEGHGIFQEEVREEVYQRVLAFLDRYLAPVTDSTASGANPQ